VLALFFTTTGYRILGLLHILAVVAAFGPLFIYPSMQRSGATDALARLHMRIVLPALTLSWVLGMGLVGMSKPEGSDEAVFKMTQTWIVLALIIWVILMVVSWFLVRPALTDRSDTARSRLSAGIGVTHLLLIVQLYLMIWKPGLS
jgi:uncharacterized membrane protein